MKKFKCLIIILIIFILCGCSLKEEVTLNTDGTVDEKLIIPVETNGMNQQELLNYVNNITRGYDIAIKTREYKKSVIYDKKSSNIVISNKFNNLCEFVNKTLASQYVYKIIRCTETDFYYEIKNETPHIRYCPDCTSSPALEKVEFTLKLPFKNAETNADSVDKKNYTWYYDSNTSDDKNIYIKIYKDDIKNSLKKEKNNKTIKTIFIILSVIILVPLFIIFLYKKFKEKYDDHNKMEY